jgi:hypothetical protein
MSPTKTALEASTFNDFNAFSKISGLGLRLLTSPLMITASKNRFKLNLSSNFHPYSGKQRGYGKAWDLSVSKPDTMLTFDFHVFGVPRVFGDLRLFFNFKKFLKRSNLGVPKQKMGFPRKIYIILFQTPEIYMKVLFMYRSFLTVLQSNNLPRFFELCQFLRAETNKLTLGLISNLQNC